MRGLAGAGGVLRETVTIQSEVRLTYFGTISKQKCLRHSILRQCLRWRRWWLGHEHGKMIICPFTLSFSLLILSHALALPRSFSFFLCLSFGVFLSHTHRYIPPVCEWGDGYREVCHKVWDANSLRSLDENTVSFHVWKSIYLFKHTPSRSFWRK